MQINVGEKWVKYYYMKNLQKIQFGVENFQSIVYNSDNINWIGLEWKFMRVRVKNFSKRIMGWCVSNILWDFIAHGFPVILLIPIFKDIGNFFITKTYSVKLYHIALAITFILLEGIVIITHKTRKTKTETEDKNKVPDINADNDDDDLLNDADLVATQEIPTDEDKYADIDDFYFETYTKHITIYKDGHGIVINTFNIHVLNANNLKVIKRRINVEDGKKSINLPPLSTMKKLINQADLMIMDFGCLNQLIRL